LFPLVPGNDFRRFSHSFLLGAIRAVLKSPLRYIPRVCTQGFCDGGIPFAGTCCFFVWHSAARRRKALRCSDCLTRALFILLQRFRLTIPPEIISAKIFDSPWMSRFHRFPPPELPGMIIYTPPSLRCCFPHFSTLSGPFSSRTLFPFLIFVSSFGTVSYLTTGPLVRSFLLIP